MQKGTIAHHRKSRKSHKSAPKTMIYGSSTNIYGSFSWNYLHYSQKSYTFVPCLEDVIGK